MKAILTGPETGIFADYGWIDVDRGVLQWGRDRVNARISVHPETSLTWPMGHVDASAKYMRPYAWQEDNPDRVECRESFYGTSMDIVRNAAKMIMRKVEADVGSFDMRMAIALLGEGVAVRRSRWPSWRRVLSLHPLGGPDGLLTSDDLDMWKPTPADAYALDWRIATP